MQNNTIQSNYNNQNNPYITSKALGYAASGQGASSASQSSDPSVQAWVEQNKGLYESILSGTSGLSQNDINQFEQWWSWATGGSDDFGGDYGMTPVDPNGQDGISGVDSDPFGGQPGPMNNLVYTDEKTDIGFTGESRPMDIWSSEVILDVSSSSVQVNVEKTSDTRTQPPADVYKVSMMDAATGKTSTYFLHNIEDIKSFKINTPGGKHVNDPLGLAKVGSYHKPTETDPNAPAESSIPYEEQADGTRLIEAPIGQTVELTPVSDGESHQWEVYGNYDLTLKPSDTVVIRQKLDGSHVITITHRDGTTDTVLAHDPSKGNVNCTPENTTIEMEVQGPGPVVSGTKAKATKVDVGTVVNGMVSVLTSKGTDPLPAGFEDVTLNAGANGSVSTDVPADATTPDTTNGSTATYNKSKDVNVYSYDGYKDHNISVPMNGTVTIHGASYGDTMKIDSYQEGPPQKWVIEVLKDNDPNQVSKFTVTGGESARVILDAADKSSVTASNPDDLNSVQIGLDGENTATDGASQTADALSKIDGVEMTAAEIKKKATESGIDLLYPPTNFSKGSPVFDFLIAIDPQLAHLIQDAKTGGDKGILGTEIRNRLVTLLQTLYPNAGVSADNGSDTADGDDIYFGGKNYDVFDQDAGDGQYLRFTTDDTTD